MITLPSPYFCLHTEEAEIVDLNITNRSQRYGSVSSAVFRNNVLLHCNLYLYSGTSKLIILIKPPNTTDWKRYLV